jgi:hypothetical protein
LFAQKKKNEVFAIGKYLSGIYLMKERIVLEIFISFNEKVNRKSYLQL